MLPPPFQTPPEPSHKHLTPVILDDATIVALVAKVLDRSPLSIPQLARSLGMTPSAIYNYKYGHHPHLSLKWMVRLVEAVGGRVWIELPEKS